MKHNKYSYSSMEELKKDINDMALDMVVDEDIKVLKESVEIGGKVVPNRLIIQPMEGCDGTEDGKPGELTIRRYKRFGKSGAGLIWFEATAVVKEGRANPRQLFICEENKEALKDLLDITIKEAKDAYGDDFRPYTVLQLTHSGRYSRPGGKGVPIIAANNEYLDPKLPPKYHVITDEELEALEDKYVQAAELAKEIGFDAVDIKSCHRYLISELFSAHTREGKYGGSFENRVRFILNVIDKIKAKLGDSIGITTRMNAYDSIPYPYGWGVDKDDFKKYDLTEPIKFVKLLQERGIKLLDITCGNPYYNPHVNRPYDTGPYLPKEHPLQGVNKMLKITSEIQKEVPDMVVIASGLTWLRDFAPNVAAGCMQENWFKLAGFGRQAFAYPEFAKDILTNGTMDKKKCCITCGKCSEIMRDGGTSGCVIKDNEVYGPIYKKGREGKPSLASTHTANHV